MKRPGGWGRDNRRLMLAIGAGLFAATQVLPIYLPLHPEARLDEATKAELVAGLAATFGERRAKR